MGTIASVSVPAAEAGRLAADRDEVAASFERIESLLSVFRPGSDVSRINRATAGTEVTVAPETALVIRGALDAAGRSGGAFDPTVGPLMAAWGFRGGKPPEAPPSDEALSDARSRVGWTNLLLRGSGVQWTRDGMALDLGGIAKGFAVDAGWERLYASGGRHYLVDLGGNLRCAGSAAPDRQGWRVGVRNPFDTSRTLGLLVLTNGEAVATSGNYERFVAIGGRRYSHVMDPRTGRPAEGTAGVTVLAPSAFLSDALSTTLFVLGPREGMALLRRLPAGCEAVWVPDTKPVRLLASSGFARRFVPHREFSGAVTVLP
jgi:thiamine biosynthesis lipoprotein